MTNFLKNDKWKTCSRNFLGTNKIDWKFDKKQIVEKLLEKEGCVKESNNENDVKMKIMRMLEMTKKGQIPKIAELNTVYNNLEKLDHFDYVRVDQIITIMYNKKETEYQWASVCMNKKWKTL